VVGAPDLSTVADTNSPVGTYDITNLVGSLASTNYTFSLTNGTLTIAVAAITVTADNQSRGYGAANPTLTTSCSGFVNGDDASVISGAPVLSVSADTNSPVGTYTIGATTGSLSATNYAFTLVNGSLDVTQVNLTVTANAGSKTYDGQAYSGGNGVSYAGFVNAEDASVLGGTLSYSGTSQGAIAAGSFVITPGGLTSGNYAISFVNGTLTVTAATPVAINKPTLLGDGSIQLTFAGGDAGVNYRIQASTDLAVWSTLVTNLAGTYGLPSFIDTDATNRVLKFYRTVTP